MWPEIQKHWRDGIEILVLAVCIYQIYRAFRATRGAQILVGLGTILVVLTLVSQVFRFEVIWWLITRASAILAFALIVIFQPELRDALARLGSKRIFSFSSRRRLAFLERFADSVIALSKKRIGALFAIQRDISLKKFLETGVVLDAQFSPEMATAVFYPKAPLHDGGMIIADDRVAGAACVFPVTQREMRDRSTGLRHRAAIGLTEETDAVAVVVSEETGGISICVDGRLERNLTEKQFRDRLADIFIAGKSLTEPEDDEELDREDTVTPSRDRDMVSD
ncbi:TIGR00159 family protein [Luteolibacter pohnpeiensis]|uniref:Diadenylate cyclase n=1 Tax=Luteolibacter pohnpeiensis TaxID=454153 RepID=A0A934S2D7_9BACT|nr:diadenylate cyclase CdaA [Luteolibacter pohnpeiensis]MBK1881156.1 TIGR00159 family protein [Luteolibacter pohnpeiensis]